MGKQIAVVMTYEDEQDFLSFLSDNREIVLIESFADEESMLFKKNFEKELMGHSRYLIWNRAFQWTPECKRSLNDNCYIANTYDAPLIEFSRSNINEKNYERLYWSKDFSAPNGLQYDIELFDKWYEDIVKWIKKSSKGKVKEKWVTYFLPFAWELYLKDLPKSATNK